MGSWPKGIRAAAVGPGERMEGAGPSGREDLEDVGSVSGAHREEDELGREVGPTKLKSTSPVDVEAGQGIGQSVS